MAITGLSRARGVVVLVGLAAALALALAASSPASAATALSPSSGPVAGGTTVSLPATTLGFIQVADGEQSGYGLSGDGHVYAWGRGPNGELGNGGTGSSVTPVRVLQGAIPADVTITQIAAGYNSAYALGSNGVIYSWGANVRGELGDGTTTQRTLPVAVDLGGLGSGVMVTQLVGAGLGAYALTSDGTAYAWGLGGDGELGNGGNTDSLTPVAVSLASLPTGVRFSQLSAGQVTAFGLGTDGHVYSWGSDVAGALGTGGTGDRNVPTAISAGAIPPGVTITQTAGGQEGGYGLGDNGTVYAWGSNLFGDLGNGTGTDSNVPVQVSAGAIPSGLRMTAIAGGSSSGYALAGNGSMYAWGNGGNGQLGDGSGAGSGVPVLVSAGEIPSDVHITSISGGYHSALALGDDAKVYAWGDNGGDLGDGTTDQRAAPVLGASASISAVTFGGVAGTDLVDPPAATTVVTPAHVAGVVDVTLTGSIDGGATAGVATSRTLPAAFTFLAAPPPASRPAPPPVLAVTGAVLPWWLVLAGVAAILLGAIALLARRPRRSRLG